MIATYGWLACSQVATYVNSLPSLVADHWHLNQAGLAAVLLQQAAKKRRAEPGVVLQAAVGLQAQCLTSREQGGGGGGCGVVGASAAERLHELRALDDAMLAASTAAQEAASPLLLKSSSGQVARWCPKWATNNEEMSFDQSCCQS